MINKKRALATGLAAAMVLTSLPSNLPNPAEITARAATDKPNIVFVLLDDTGSREFGCYGNTFNETPNIDRIASEGAQFNQYYTQPVCSPSRSCLMTGNNTLRTGITNFLPDPLSTYLSPQEFETLPQVLDDAGYHTGLLGKWHLSAASQHDTSPGAPQHHGWDEIIMSEQKYIGAGDYFFPYFHLPQVTGQPQNRFLVDHMNEQAVDYIERNKDEPFMLYLSHYATHTTLDAPKATVDYFQQKRGASADRNTNKQNPYLAAMLKHVDDGIGMIDDKLEQLGLADNTIFVIASDNGGETGVTINGELRGGKRQLYEGGLRDPMIIRWPKTLKQGIKSDYPCSVIDFYQTLSEAAGIPPEQVPKNSGVSLLPILEGKPDPDRDTLYWCYPRNTDYTPGTKFGLNSEFVEGGAIRVGDYKYLESFAFDRREMYNLAEDPGEQRNIIEQNTERYHQMARLLHQKLEGDTIGKVFSDTCEADDNYRNNTVGGFNKANGTFVSTSAPLSIMTYEDELFYDTDSQVQIKPDASDSAGLVFRSNLATPQNGAYKSYAALLNRKAGTVQLVKVIASDVTVIAEAAADIKSDKTYTLQVKCDSDKIDILLDGKQVLTHYDESFMKGSFGFIARGGKAVFDNLTIKGIEGTRETTVQQLNFRPDSTYTIKADDRWIQFDTEPKMESGSLAAQANKLFDSLMIKSDFDKTSGRLTAEGYGVKAEFAADSDKALVGSETITLPCSAKASGDTLILPVTAVVDIFDLNYTQTENTVEISTASTEHYRCNDSRIKYVGNWTNVAQTKRSSKADEYAELTFNGTGVKLYLDRGVNGAIFKVYIDGVMVQTVNAYNPSALEHSLMFEISGLTEGEHTIKAVNTGTRSTSGTDTNLNINEFVVTKRADPNSISETLVLQNDPAVKYTGTWNPVACDGFGGSVMRSSAANASAELEFEGTGIRLYLARGTGAGLADVYIDGVKAETIDTYYGSAIQQSLMYENTSLADGNHTIKVVNLGQKSPNGVNTNINIDAFGVLKSPTSELLSGECEITGFTIAGQSGNTKINQKTGKITLAVPDTVNLKSVTPSIVYSKDATISPDTAVDLTAPVKYTVTAQNGKDKKSYTVAVEIIKTQNPNPDPKPDPGEDKKPDDNKKPDVQKPGSTVKPAKVKAPAKLRKFTAKKKGRKITLTIKKSASKNKTYIEYRKNKGKFKKLTITAKTKFTKKFKKGKYQFRAYSYIKVDKKAYKSKKYRTVKVTVK